MDHFKSCSLLKETPSSLRAKRFINKRILKPPRQPNEKSPNKQKILNSTASFSFLSSTSTAHQSQRSSFDDKSLRHAGNLKISSTLKITNVPKPMSGVEALKAHSKCLNRFEMREIQKFKFIYYVRKAFTEYKEEFFLKEGEYLVVLGDAICYRYEILEVIDSGSFGQVLRCQDHKTGEAVAVKVLKNHYDAKKLGLNEFKIVEMLGRGLDHNNIVRVKKRFTFRGHFFMVFELLGINLYYFLHLNNYQPISPNLAKRITVQLLTGLQHIHACNVIHCDLKPENIVFKQNNKSSIRIIDFGTSILNSKFFFTYFQTRLYRAPEVVFQTKDYGPEIDIWSLGCIVCELLLGVPIFCGENEEELLISFCQMLGPPPLSLLEKSTENQDFSLLSWKEEPMLRQVLSAYPSYIIEFVEQCLAWDPQRRVSARQGLQSKWFQISHSRNSSFEDSLV
jgi:dual specificity tyrosine-phosphorylation-regulated kinase 2/3/4